MSCHKYCRNFIKVNCFEHTSSALIDEYGEDVKTLNLFLLYIK